MAYGDLSLFRPGGGDPVEARESARAAATQKASYLSQMDQFYAQLDFMKEVEVGKREMFTEEGYAFIHKASEGIPRRINNICDMCLLVGFGSKGCVVEQPGGCFGSFGQSQESLAENYQGGNNGI